MLDLPVISVTRDKPDLQQIKSALIRIPDFNKRWEAIKNAGDLYSVKTRTGENPIYVQSVGVLREDAEKILKTTSIRSNIPEALRVAHIIASGLTGLREKL